MRILSTCLLALSLALPSALAAADVAGKPLYASKVVTEGTVDIDIDITGANELWLVVTDGGNGYAADWADWVDPVVVGPAGEVKLSGVKPKSSATGWGSIGIDKNADGREMKIAGKPVTGIGVHAPSSLVFDIAGKGYTRFKAKAGVDNGGTDQGSGTSVSFMVFTSKPAQKYLSPSAIGGREPADALAALQVADGLAVNTWAAEPLFSNPTNIDVDAYGRVWVCEGVNYRRWYNNKMEGDRIVVLEDKDLDGVAETSTVFYQGGDVNAALGICVLGNRVFVSCSPNVFVFTDTDGDLKADKKEVLFSGIAGHQHDHGMHTFQAGPDGKLYFNFGNDGHQLKDKDGKPVVDLAGNEINHHGKPYRQGMVFRCDPDGSNVETLGHNFRNNYEVTVDSFGAMWQSDNDDDGNKAVRIAYVMDYGNFGYTDEFTGAGWGQKRTNIEAEIPRRHWHLNDPGVVPTMLITGSGSPTGITVYEGDLLPEVFRGQVIHTDAGPNVCRAYPTKPDGAGYSATMENILKGTDSWFRPSDVAVMPDGALMVADWYDPGVGGHNMGDNTPGETKGRLYRVAPPGNKPAVTKLDLSSAAGAVEALQSPNYARRFLAVTRLKELGAAAVPDLTKLLGSSNQRYRARALWVLGQIKGQEAKWIDTAIKDADADIKSVGLRLARELKVDLLPLVQSLAKDPSPQVRRECAIALRFQKTPAAAALWAELAASHDGKDRWYLEALGIGAALNEDACFDAWAKKVGDAWNTPAGRDIVWRSRSAKALPFLVKIIKDAKTPEAEQARYMRAFDFHTGAAKDEALKSLLE
jgi:putative membrane-bound dehydrogenase-like protein